MFCLRKILVRHVGVKLHNKSNVQGVVKASNYHIRALRHIRPMLDRELAHTIACSIVSTRLDYCNSLLYGTKISRQTLLY